MKWSVTDAVKWVLMASKCTHKQPTAPSVDIAASNKIILDYCTNRLMTFIS